MGDVASFQFRAPADLMNLNDRMHWAKRASLAKAWRETTGWNAIAQLPKLFRPCPGFVGVSICLPVTSMRRRDAHNFVATTKPIVDGLVDAKVVADDDTTHLMTTEPTFKVSQFVVVTITQL